MITVDRGKQIAMPKEVYAEERGKQQKKVSSIPEIVRFLEPTERVTQPIVSSSSTLRRTSWCGQNKRLRCKRTIKSMRFVELLISGFPYNSSLLWKLLQTGGKVQ
ncbi:uncharacterized protein LOC129739959 [Uranotaenia lowii]|uniref:uncharacterized protein LOC129739959 n=1 Tax=Uranotaenia lowii TaxID=190385 RepID=UPI00247AD3F4|nr:uncharacterized protein LOC129739959 [Uranotaenia lowii]